MIFPCGKRCRKFLHPITIVVLLLAFLSSPGMWAAPPPWWSSRGVIQSGGSADDYGLLNQGQLKNLAAAAAAEMNAVFPDGAGTPIDDMVDAWTNDTTEADDYALANVGQLKAVAAPFYDRLTGLGLVSGRPWTAETTDDDDYAPANIGQAKALFSFAVVSPFEHIMSDPLWETLENILNGNFVGVLSEEDYAALQDLIARLTSPALSAALAAELAKANPAPAAGQVAAGQTQAQSPAGQDNVAAAGPVPTMVLDYRYKRYFFQASLDSGGILEDEEVYLAEAFGHTSEGQFAYHSSTNAGQTKQAEIEADFLAQPFSAEADVITLPFSPTILTRWHETHTSDNPETGVHSDVETGGGYQGAVEIRPRVDERPAPPSGPVVVEQHNLLVLVRQQSDFTWGGTLPPSDTDWPVTKSGVLRFIKTSDGVTKIDWDGAPLTDEAYTGVPIVKIAQDQRSVVIMPPGLSGDDWGCSVELVPAQLETIGFNPDHANKITTDNGLPEYKDQQGDNGQWKIRDGRNWPLSYQVGQNISLRAKIRLPGLAAGTPVTITAESSPGLHATWSVEASGELLDLPYSLPTTAALPDSVQCRNKNDATAFEIQWSAKIGAGPVFSLGTTKHTLYTTLRQNSLISHPLKPRIILRVTAPWA